MMINGDSDTVLVAVINDDDGDDGDDNDDDKKVL